ncbi:MAG: tyrosine recombinase XerC [Bacilli bacterium]|nr:tyrosine recombinase XerC [Bacilli bacterium]
MIELKEQFIKYLEIEKRYSKYTIINYQKDLEVFLLFLNKEDIANILKVDHQVIRNYLINIYNKKYTSKTIARKISTLRSFFKYLLKEHIIEINPMLLISNPKEEKKLPRLLYGNELEIMQKVPNQNTPLGSRDALIIEMLYSTGIRVSELVNIKVSDISFNDNIIKILGKGNKERYVIYGSYCKKLLNPYINSYRQTLIKDKDTPYLFINKNGTRLTDRGVRLIIDNITKKSTVKKKVSPHMLRHTFATDMLNHGADLKTVQELLGHSNLKTTEIYTHLTSNYIKQVYENTHPRAKRGNKNG